MDLKLFCPLLIFTLFANSSETDSKIIEGSSEGKITSDSTFYNIEKSVVPSDSLIVESGETKTISNRTYQYKYLHIKPGGFLKVQNSSIHWCILWVTGDVIIEGTIEAKNFRVSRNEIKDNTPDGKELTHTYNLTAEGGTGGNGGNSAVSSVVPGGSGARGSAEWGGGGGSGGGVHIAGQQSRNGGPGVNATDWRGAPLAQDASSNVGGDGTRINPKGNGGLLMIYCTGTFKGANGKIDIRGTNGARGSRGGDGFSSTRGISGAGGGGGGAPGNEGGYAIIVANQYESECEVLTAGGYGGTGGAPGQYPNEATAGKTGQQGVAGLVDWLTLNQWNN